MAIIVMNALFIMGHHLTAMSDFKCCPKCKVEKPITEYYRTKTGPKWDCKTCAQALVKAWRIANHDRNLARKRKWTEKNKERVKETSAAWHRAHSEENRERGRRWKKEHPGYKYDDVREWRNNNKIKVRELNAKWRAANKATILANNAKRRALELTAMPAWADLEKIKKFYERSRRMTEETGVVHHVDHIVPLKSPVVCGLHCEFNLQILPGIENISKGNRSWPDMPSLTVAELVEARRWIKENS